MRSFGGMDRLARDVALATATATAIGYTYGAHAPVLPLISAEFALSDVQAGLISTALFLAASATMIGLGDLADRYPPRGAISFGMALAIAGNIGSALAPSYELLLLAKAVGGLGAGFAFLGGIRYIARRYGEARSHFGQGLYGAGYPLGTVIALWGMPAIAVAYGWRGGFWASTALMAIVVIAWLRATPLDRRHGAAGNMLDAARCRNCWYTFFQHAAGFGLVFAAGTWITTFLVREYELPLAASGLLGSVLLVVAVLARPIGGYLVARGHLATRSVMRAAQLTILVGVVLIAFPGRPLLAALAGAVALGLGGGVPYAAVFNTAAASLRGAPSAATGLTALGGLMGTLVGAPAMGFAFQTWGSSWAWLILGAVSATALGITFVMDGEEELTRG